MFATRDQENLVHGHQQLAAAKPLNHGINRLAPKTPNNGLKSSYGGLMTGKIRGGDDENVVFGGKKGGNVEKHAFQTPMGLLLIRCEPDGQFACIGASANHNGSATRACAARCEDHQRARSGVSDPRPLEGSKGTKAAAAEHQRPQAEAEDPPVHAAGGSRAGRRAGGRV